MSVIASDDLKYLLAERQALLDRLFDGTITRAQSGRLAWVRWQLDNIEARARQDGPQESC